MYKIGFPRLDNYYIPVNYFIKKALKLEVVDTPKITARTIEIGNKYSPDTVCTPFKYTLGGMVESLELGANVLIQLGGGCRYGYYHELQEKILKDLGYNFTMINLVNGGVRINIFKLLDKSGIKYSKIKFLYYLFITIKMVKYMDLIDDYIRLNSCYLKDFNAYKKLRKEMLEEFSKCNTYLKLYKTYKKYLRKFKKVELDKNRKVLKIGLIGELYTLMEPFANYNIEDLLIESNVSITRYTNATYLLFKKKNKVKKILRNFFIKYRMGADALDNIYHTSYFIKKKYDGVIHIKSVFCTPEIGAMGIIKKIAEEGNMPTLFFSMDVNTSEVGIKTRLEAFIDMLEMRQK